MTSRFGMDLRRRVLLSRIAAAEDAHAATPRPVVGTGDWDARQREARAQQNWEDTTNYGVLVTRLNVSGTDRERVENARTLRALCGGLLVRICGDRVKTTPYGRQTLGRKP